MFRFLKILIILSVFFFLNCYKPGAEIVDGILAVVNNEVITQSELNEILIPIYTQYKSTYTDEELVQKLEEARRKILSQLIDDKIVIQEAKRREITVGDKEIEERLEQIKSQFSNEDEFKRALQSQNLTISDLKEKYKEQIMIKKIISEEVSLKIEVTPTEVVRYYEQHMEEFRIPAQVKVQTILIRKDNNQSEDGIEPQEKIKEVYEKLKNAGDFSKLAREYSEDPSAINDGDLGYIKKNQMMEKIDNVLFSQELGEISDIIETSVGYHIFKVTEIKESSIKSFEDARLNIEDILFEEKAKVKFNEWMRNLKENAYISIK